MTWSRLTARGAGKLAWRVSVEGWPYEFVTHSEMVLPIQKDGVTEWSASNYYSRASTAPGSGNMTRSVYVQYDSNTGGSQNLLEEQVGTTGWLLFIDSSNRATWRIFDGATSYTIVSAALSTGVTYAITCSYDGTNLRLVVGQTASTPVAASFAASVGTAFALGALAGGGSPASGCTILGAAVTDDVALTDAQMLAHNARVAARGAMVDLLDGEHLYRAPDLATDVVGSADWTVNGRPTLTTVDAVTGEWGRKRIGGLKSDGFELAEKVDPITASWEPDGFSVIVGGGAKQKRNDAAQAFAGPTLRTWLLDDATAAQSFIDVRSTAGWPSTGVIHIGTEAIRYSGKTATRFTGCSRGIWGTVPQAHYIDASTEDVLQPEVVNAPRVLEGRRVKLYAYGPGDDKQGDGGNGGDPVWFGVAATGPKFDGLNWSFMVDGPDRLLDTELGADMGDGLPLRGIYYSEVSPLYMRIVEYDGALPRTITASTRLAVTGFWETQAAFVADLTTYLDDAVFTSNELGSFEMTSIEAIEIGDSWGIRIVSSSTPGTGTSAAPETKMSGPGGVDDRISVMDGRIQEHPYRGDDPAKLPQTSLAVSTAYVFPLRGEDDLDQPGTVPRASLRVARLIPDDLPAANRYAKDSASWPPGRFYVGGMAPLTGTVTQATLSWDANGSGIASEDTASPSWDVDSVSATDRYLQLDAVRARFTTDVQVATAANVPTAQFGIKYTTGTLADFLNAITGLWSDNINRGTVPDLRNDDIDLTGESLAAIETAALSTHYTSARRFLYSAPVKLRDVVEQECRLLGVHPAMGSDGKIVFRRLRVPAPSEAAAGTLTKTDILPEDAFLGYEHGQFALWNTVRFLTGYSPYEDEHNGDTVTVVDADARGLNPRARVLEVAPLSEDPGVPIDHAELRRLAGRVLGTFGGEYYVLTVAVPLTKLAIGVGDVVSVTWEKIPDEIGDLGVTEKLGYVTSREWAPMAGRGVLQIILHNQRVGGYVPEARVTSIVDNGGNAYTFTVTATGYLPAGTTAEHHWRIGDKIRVFRWDSTVVGTINGEVTSVSGDTVSILLGSSWTFGGSSWCLGSQVSTAITTDTQKVYVYLARTDGLVHWAASDTDDAFTMS